MVRSDKHPIPIMWICLPIERACGHPVALCINTEAAIKTHSCRIIKPDYTQTVSLVVDIMADVRKLDYRYTQTVSPVVNTMADVRIAEGIARKVIIVTVAPFTRICQCG